MRLVVLIDGEHYPPVVRAAIDDVRASGDEVVAAVFCGGTEKIGPGDLRDAYGVDVERGADRLDVLRTTLRRHRPDAVLDLTDEPVVTAADRFRIAGEILSTGAVYLGPDFELRPAPLERVLSKPSIRVIATGKRTGKTAVAGALARHAVSRGRHPVIVAMGRGGPPDPEVLEVGDDLSVEALVALSDGGRHAASDYIEDALCARVPTIGCRRVGGGLAGATFRSNVVEGARIAEGRDEDLVILEGSGAAVPPVETGGGLICVRATDDPSVVRSHLGPYRLLLADLAVATMAEKDAPVGRIEAAIHETTPGLPILRAVFRPRPLEEVSGRRVFFCCTSPSRVLPLLAAHLQEVYGCEVVGMTNRLADRGALKRDLDDAPDHEVLLTEVKAAAVDVAARVALDAGRRVVFSDNEMVAPDGSRDAAASAFDRVIERADGERDG